MASTTIDLDTELSAVNSILGAIGQSPITQLKDPNTGVITNANPEIQFIYNLLKDSNVDVQAEGWHFNKENHVRYTPDSVTGKIALGADILQLDVTDGWKHRQYDVVRRSGHLYDKYDHTDDFSDVSEIYLDVVKLYAFEDVPPVFRRFISYRASRQAAVQLVSNPGLVQLLGVQEQQARAALMEYECNQGNHNMFGLPEDSSYTAYEPWRNLVR